MPKLRKITKEEFNTPKHSSEYYDKLRANEHMLRVRMLEYDGGMQEMQKQLEELEHNYNITEEAYLARKQQLENLLSRATISYNAMYAEWESTVAALREIDASFNAPQE